MSATTLATLQGWAPTCLNPTLDPSSRPPRSPSRSPPRTATRSRARRLRASRLPSCCRRPASSARASASSPCRPTRRDRCAASARGVGSREARRTGAWRLNQGAGGA
eukprot:scaffold2495_cov101-Isochrysis_galbana.AAC.7